MEDQRGAMVLYDSQCETDLGTSFFQLSILLDVIILLGDRVELENAKVEKKHAFFQIFNITVRNNNSTEQTKVKMIEDEFFTRICYPQFSKNCDVSEITMHEF